MVRLRSVLWIPGLAIGVVLVVVNLPRTSIPSSPAPAEPAPARNASRDFSYGSVARHEAFNAALVLEDSTETRATTELASAEGSWARQLKELRELASTDSAAALAKVSEMSVAEEREVALREVCLELAARDPAQAMNVAWDFQLGKLGGLTEERALEDLASQWATVDLPAAIAWIDRQSPDETGQRDRVIKGITAVWSRRAPADAADFVALAMSPDRIQFEAAMGVIEQWATTDFSGAAAWVDIFPEGPLQDQGREVLLKASPVN